MKFGLLLDTLDPGEMLTLARLAEEAGFDSVWLAEGHFSSDGVCPAPQVAAAAVAATTEAIRIGLVASLGLYHPMYTAEDVAVLDNISNGRTLLLAAKPRAEEAAACGTPSANIEERFREALEICLAAWSPLPFRHEGQHFRVPACLPENVHAAAFTQVSVTPKPAQPRLPVWVAARDEDAVRLAARLGLPIAGEAESAVEELRSRFELYRSLAGEAPGRSLALMREVDGSDIRRCSEEIEWYRDELGVSYLICRLAGDRAARGEAVERLGREVMPQFHMSGYPQELRRVSS